MCAERELYEFVRPLLALLEDHAIRPVFVSGCQEEILALVAHDLGVVHWYGSRFATVGGQYTGEVASSPATPGGKAKALLAVESAMTVNWARSLAIGDSITDVELFDVVGSGFVICTDGKVPGQQELARGSVGTHVRFCSPTGVIEAVRSMLT